ncbi:MAG: hypothetical protein ACRD2G_04470, partial [Terriglobia bacterium]
GVVNAILGGWQASAIYSAQSGFPLGMGNIAYFGNPDNVRASISGRTIDQAFNDISGFYPGGVVNPANSAIRLSDNYRTFPRYLPNLRSEPLNNIDASAFKVFYLGKNEARNFQFRADFLNAFNHPFFGAPNTSPSSSEFGVITGTSNLPRQVQFALQFNF